VWFLKSSFFIWLIWNLKRISILTSLNSTTNYFKVKFVFMAFASVMLCTTPFLLLAKIEDFSNILVCLFALFCLFFCLLLQKLKIFLICRSVSIVCFTICLYVCECDNSGMLSAIFVKLYQSIWKDKSEAVYFDSICQRSRWLWPHLHDFHHIWHNAWCLLVCLSVYVQDISKHEAPIWKELGGQFGCVRRTKWLDFGEDPDTNP